MNTQALLDKLQNNPQIQQAIAQSVQGLAQDPDLNPQLIDRLMEMFETAIQNPESYPELRQIAIQSGLDEQDLPEQFDPVMLGIILLALHMLRQRMSWQPQNFARGGLIGSLWDGLKGVVKSVAPVLPLALSFLAPGVGSAIGGALGASGAWAPALGNAVIGGGLSALAGGDALTGALGGAASGYFGDKMAQPDSGFGLNMKTMGMALPALSLLGAAQQPQSAGQGAAPARTAAQEEYFNRPLQTFDWNKVSQDAAASGMTPNEYMARNWNKMTSENAYNAPVVRKARGGALSQVAYLAEGAGTGRSDDIEARLSDGEYVVDAETVALLGDGSTKAGAAKLEHMRQQIRKQKGAALAKGKFSPDAKSPLMYLKEAA